jgi:hypothetical protein
MARTSLRDVSVSFPIFAQHTRSIKTAVFSKLGGNLGPDNDTVIVRALPERVLRTAWPRPARCYRTQRGRRDQEVGRRAFAPFQGNSDLPPDHLVHNDNVRLDRGRDSEREAHKHAARMGAYWQIEILAKFRELTDRGANASASANIDRRNTLRKMMFCQPVAPGPCRA